LGGQAVQPPGLPQQGLVMSREQSKSASMKFHPLVFGQHSVFGLEHPLDLSNTLENSAREVIPRRVHHSAPALLDEAPHYLFVGG